MEVKVTDAAKSRLVAMGVPEGSRLRLTADIEAHVSCACQYDIHMIADGAPPLAVSLNYDVRMDDAAKNLLTDEEEPLVLDYIPLSGLVLRSPNETLAHNIQVKM
ncbi:iron-sulfur cluster biosynthesis family protein [Alicyclobacillus fructus]|uniref:iron-sulfur cluster biosynthesis family protein n=1 Tax=Alicyclobacillus fructus TaxID=2816082 RepID=UPI001A8CC7CC|nr:iron-sulfur cluster biosynthesis family protein [Alicyclobacillus fructus]